MKNKEYILFLINNLLYFFYYPKNTINKINKEIFNLIIFFILFFCHLWKLKNFILKII